VCIFHLYGEQKLLGGLSLDFLVVGVHDVITPFKFGDDRFRGFGLAGGQSLPFPIYFEDRPYNTHTIVVMLGLQPLRLFQSNIILVKIKPNFCFGFTHSFVCKMTKNAQILQKSQNRAHI